MTHILIMAYNVRKFIDWHYSLWTVLCTQRAKNNMMHDRTWLLWQFNRQVKRIFATWNRRKTRSTVNVIHFELCHCRKPRRKKAKNSSGQCSYEAYYPVKLIFCYQNLRQWKNKLPIDYIKICVLTVLLLLLLINKVCALSLSILIIAVLRAEWLFVL